MIESRLRELHRLTWFHDGLVAKALQSVPPPLHAAVVKHIEDQVRAIPQCAIGHGEVVRAINSALSRYGYGPYQPFSRA